VGSLPLSLGAAPGPGPAARHQGGLPLAAGSPPSRRVFKLPGCPGGGFPQGPGSARWRMSGLGLPVSVAAASGFEVAFDQTRKSESPIPVPPIPDLTGKWGGNFKFRFSTRPGTTELGIGQPPGSSRVFNEPAIPGSSGLKYLR
jgi:hypothetical protein